MFTRVGWQVTLCDATSLWQVKPRIALRWSFIKSSTLLNNLVLFPSNGPHFPYRNIAILLWVSAGSRHVTTGGLETASPAQICSLPPLTPL